MVSASMRSLGNSVQASRPATRWSHSFSGDVDPPGNRQAMPMTAIGGYLSSPRGDIVLGKGKGGGGALCVSLVEWLWGRKQGIKRSS